MRIVLQKSHVNISNNSIVALRSATGAPNEQKFNSSVVDKLALELKKYNIEVIITDANANDDVNITSQDHDLFLSVHYDADVYSDTGGFVDFPDPSVDFVTETSQKIAKEIEKTYFSTTKIKNVPSRRNANTKFYYMWRYLSKKTPCVIIECGVGNRKPEDNNTLFNKQDLVVNGILQGILNAFGINGSNEFDPTTQLPVTARQTKEFIELKKMKLAQESDAFDTLLSRLIENINDLQQKVKQGNTIKDKIINFIKNL